ncbi:MAG: DUF3179 domain-containing protein [Anaerolineaceae bacterium]|nr:DUF3179 domain-containing protein [Anaerolineaceae bacterium]
MKKQTLFVIIIWILLLSACSSSPDRTISELQPTESLEPTKVLIIEDTKTVPVIPTLTAEILDESPPRGASAEFSTDFSVHSISYDEVLSGGPPKDGIPPIDDPVFVSVSEADDWIEAVEPVIQLVINGEVKAYPLQVLIWHEIVNDSVGGVPVTVSFCPLCNTAIVFERTVNGDVLDFGTTGRLRYSNLIMYDRQTESWWQQATGESIVGELTGTQLTFVPAVMISWENFKDTHPEGSVLSRDTGFMRSYGSNPYGGYDDINQPPFLYYGPLTPDNLPPVARIIAVEFGDESMAYPYDLLEELHVINDEVGEEEIVIFWSPGTSSALDKSNISEGRDVGSPSVFSRKLDGEVFDFEFNGTAFVDVQTLSVWNMQGLAVEGDMTGQQLSPLVAVNHFWFSWAAFKPETQVYQP